MGSITKRIESTERHQVIDLTGIVQQVVRDSGVVDGICVVFIPHTTAGVTVNENFDPDVKHDVLSKLAALVPEHESYYQHAEGNSDAHLKASLVGNNATLLVDGGRLVLGRWQGVYFCEFDGPRMRDVLVKVLGDARRSASREAEGDVNESDLLQD